MPPKYLMFVILVCLVINVVLMDAAPTAAQDDNEPMETKNNPGGVVQIERPLSNDVIRRRPYNQIARPQSDAEQELSKGPLSGVIPGGESTTTSTTPTLTSPSGLLSGGLPGGIGGNEGDDKQQSPTLVLGGFSALLIPTRGMSMSNIMSMMSTGQQLSQLIPTSGS
ncbi:uncharacterized protein LOC126847204 isoform X2 [Adelges cooleyi]|uniref:uncharacterized protein LOC126847204 isoform X2 n=1 Tax=Adelges cooleyi TaxID=133065 RepID=UPI00218075BB|nr:uncharacterized protein LOC126847204 isoform X2 [Adelges cooleyi]